MPARPEPSSHEDLSRLRRAALIDGLRDLPDVNDLSLAGLRAVTAIRLLALCRKACHDPLLELTRRFGDLNQAREFCVLANLIGAIWPETFRVMRPCCRSLSPDETLLAQMVVSARNGDRAGFGQLLSGYVKHGREQMLYDAAVRYAVLSN